MVSEALGKIQERVVQVKISPSFFPAYEELCSGSEAWWAITGCDREDITKRIREFDQGAKVIDALNQPPTAYLWTLCDVKFICRLLLLKPLFSRCLLLGEKSSQLIKDEIIFKGGNYTFS